MQYYSMHCSTIYEAPCRMPHSHSIYPEPCTTINSAYYLAIVQYKCVLVKENEGEVNEVNEAPVTFFATAVVLPQTQKKTGESRLVVQNTSLGGAMFMHLACSVGYLESSLLSLSSFIPLIDAHF